MKRTPMNNSAEVRRIIRAIDLQRQEVEQMILRTPTGSDRNFLTEANILILEAINKLLEVS